jgi:hypothetical protein
MMQKVADTAKRSMVAIPEKMNFTERSIAA